MNEYSNFQYPLAIQLPLDFIAITGGMIKPKSLKSTDESDNYRTAVFAINILKLFGIKGSHGTLSLGGESKEKSKLFIYA